VLAPLFPQFSTTTSGSALAAWRGAYRGPGRTHGLCCWFANRGFIEAHVGAIKRTWETAGRPQARLLFSAHGLPLRTAARGDPYAWQIEETCKAVVDGLEGTWDWRLCYQSRVGPMKWLGPSTPDALRAAAADRTGVIVVPISFVSEHIETLVELDRDYRRLAEALGLPFYLRVPALGADPAFIGGLAEAVIQALGRPTIGPEGPECPAQFAACGRIAPARSRLQPAIEGAA
jgi:ferrochelatase